MAKPKSSNVELMPCPFCGSQYADIFMWHIACSNCGAATRDLTREELGALLAISERCDRMVSIWNKRPLAPETQVHHVAECNYQQGPIGGEGCICIVVNRICAYFPPVAITKRAIECGHEKATIQCPDCGIDLRGCLMPKHHTEEVVVSNVVVELLRDCRTAIRDWVMLYTPELCRHDDVRAAQERIAEGGGTLYYAGELISRINDMLERLSHETSERQPTHRTDSRLAGDIEYCLAKINPATDVHAILTEVMKDLRTPAETTPSRDCSTGAGGVSLVQMAENIRHGLDPYAESPRAQQTARSKEVVPELGSAHEQVDCPDPAHCPICSGTQTR